MKPFNSAGNTGSDLGMTARLRIIIFLPMLWAILTTGCSDSNQASSNIQNTNPILQVEMAEPRVAIASSTIESLYSQSVSDSQPEDISALSSQLAQASQSDPNWPLLCYLTGEVQSRFGDSQAARHSFSLLLNWAVRLSDDQPYLVRWGGSGVVGMGVWRLLTIVYGQQDQPDNQEITDLFGKIDRITKTPFFVGMGSNTLLPSVPKLKENIAKLMVSISWRSGMQKEARKRYVDFVSVDSTKGEDSREISAIRDGLIAQGQISRVRLKSFQLHRQLKFTMTKQRKNQVIEELRGLWENLSIPDDIRAKAGYEVAYSYRFDRRKRNDAIHIYESIIAQYAEKYPLTTQKALYQIGMLYNRGRTNGRDRIKFFEYMQRIINTYPEGDVADSALYQVASEYLFFPQPDYTKAIDYFKQLREFKGANDWLDSAHFLAAIALINRNQTGDLEQADQLLQDYLTHLPKGAFQLRSRFWRGRIAELQGDRDKAKKLFSELVELVPFDYYGIRAKMHLESGQQAINKGIPAKNSNVWKDFNKVFQTSSIVSDLTNLTPFHQRLANNQKLYLQTKAAVDGIGKLFKNRVDNIALEELDERHLIPAVSLLLAFREDARAARSSVDTAGNYLHLGGFFGEKLADWPMALQMLQIRSTESAALMKEMQNDPHYLATAYPNLALLPDIQKAIDVALDQYRWAMPELDEFSKSLIYAVIRQESSFFSAAISKTGAIGLFQLMPYVYESAKLKTCRSGCPRFSPFIAMCNITFWSCWANKEHLMESPSGIAGSDDLRLAAIFGMVKHNAGIGNLRRWVYEWGDNPITRDLEMKIDTFRFHETQHFVRRAMSYVTILESSGMFSSAVASEGGSNDE